MSDLEPDRDGVLVICPVCGISFHYCSSCCISYNWETTYCSEKCWYASPEYTDMQRRFAEICSALDPATCTQFVEFVDDILCSDFDEFDVRAWAESGRQLPTTNVVGLRP